MEFAEYVEDVRTQKAVAFNYAIIGDALNRLKQTSPDLATRIPQLRQIVGFRNLLVHDYSGVSQNRVWRYSGEYLQQLQNSIRALLAELDPPLEVGEAATKTGPSPALEPDVPETDTSSCEPF
ncbi:MAG: DUF86 domain-containing protein [Albidovulum sp.]|nr:DUF86 domain-containing protein [Albidovulum sp.]